MNLIALTLVGVLVCTQSLHLVEVPNGITTTTDVPEATTLENKPANAWVGRRFDAEHIINDINNEIKTENDIPDEDFKPDRHPCDRKCIEGEAPMICKYHFTVEWYQILSKACYDCPYNQTDCGRLHCITGDGIKRPVLVVNRQMPGPAIEVCLHDEVLVEVENALLEEGTSVHWHGQHQRGTPYMDGVPFVTQCPISPKSTFTYRYD